MKAQRVRQLVAQDFKSVFEHDNNGGCVESDVSVDVIITPTTMGCAPSIRNAAESGGLEEYVNDVFTVPASLAGTNEGVWARSRRVLTQRRGAGNSRANLLQEQ